MRFIASCILIAAAVCAYFIDTFGIVIDRDMVRNVAQTDATEALGLFNVRLVGYVLLLGALPAWLLMRIPLPAVSPLRHIAQRMIFLIGGAALVFAMMAPNSAKFATFVREHKPLRYLINPGNLIYASWAYLRHETVLPPARLIDVDGSVTRTSPVTGSKPLLTLLVVGETARAVDFQLMGHLRRTTPRLSARDDLYQFDQVTSCGTATAVSLPCMFTGLDRTKFDVVQAAARTNLLDTLGKAGVSVEWRDNNTGCKGVCARVPTVAMQPAMAPALCTQDYCHDEILLEGLAESIVKTNGDQLKVLHQIGSHGPAYWRRYPAAFEHFRPTCRSTNLGACSKDEIHNAYDNTILYTDHVLNKAIEILESLSDRYDTALLYVSDHGESLGENGLYLHGAPYGFAPNVQKQVPMLLWISPGAHSRLALKSGCARAARNRLLNHEHVYHTVLGIMGVRNAVYDAKRDILAACRS